MKLISMYLSTCAWSATCKTSAPELTDSVDDATTLMQTRVRRSTQPHPAIPEVQQDGVVSHVSLETVERLVNDISAKDPTAEEISLVSDLIAALENEFIPELAAQSEADSVSHATQIAAHTACITTRATRMGPGGDVTKFEEDSSKTRAKHQACRKATKSYSVFKNDLDSLSAGNWGNLAPSSDNGQLSAVLSLSANQDEFTTDVAAYRGLETEGVVSESCDVDQEAFELTWCTWLHAKVSTCQAFGQCVDQVDAAASKALIMTRDARRRATYHSMKILQCRLQHIADTFNSAGGASNSTEIDDCGDVAAPQENHYNLSLEDPTPAVGCLSDDDITDPKMPTATDPSACAQWRSKEYNADAQQHPTTWALALHSPVSKCLGTCVIAVLPDTDPNLLQHSNFWLGSVWFRDFCRDPDGVPGGTGARTRHEEAGCNQKNLIEFVDSSGRIEFPGDGVTYGNMVMGLTPAAWEAVGLSNPWASEEPWTMQLDFDWLHQAHSKDLLLKFFFNLAYEAPTHSGWTYTAAIEISPRIEVKLSNTAAMTRSIPDWDPPADQLTFRMISGYEVSQATCGAVTLDSWSDNDACGYLDVKECKFYSPDGDGNPLWYWDADSQSDGDSKSSDCFKDFWSQWSPGGTVTVLFDRKSTRKLNVKVKVGEEGAEEGTHLLFEMESDNAWSPPDNPTWADWSVGEKTMMPLGIHRQASADEPPIYLRRWRRVDAGAPPIPPQTDP